MTRAIISLLLLFCSISLKAQHYNISDFVETVAPKSNSQEWLKLNNSEFSFNVSLHDGKLVLTKPTERKKASLRFNDGQLEGVNHGEFGGQLLFKRAGFKADTIKMGNIVAIFAQAGQIYWMEGLAHMSFNEGAFYRLYQKNGRFNFSKVFDFQDAPEAYTIYKNAILVAGHNNFYSIVAEKCDLLFKDMFWESLYPNSLAVINEHEVYMGIRGGYVKLDIVNKSYKFYKYSAKL